MAWRAVKPAATWLGNVAYNTLNTGLDILTGADIAKWGEIKNWSGGDWAWVVGNTALTVGSFFFPPLAASKAGTGLRVLGKAISGLGSKAAGAASAVAAKLAPAVSWLTTKATAAGAWAGSKLATTRVAR